MRTKTTIKYAVCVILSAAAGIGGTFLVQHRDDELQVSTVGMATYFAQAWGHAIFKAYNDDKAGLNEGILISDGPLPTRSADIYSRSTGEPIMTVVMVPVMENCRRLEHHGASQQFPAPTTTITPMT